MNGKQAKMLRNMGKASKSDKRYFNTLSHTHRGALRRAAGLVVARRAEIAQTAEAIGLGE